MGLPDWSDAPGKLIGLDGNCGPLAAWTVLRHFGIRTSATSLIRSLRYSRSGVFTIGIAVALAEHRLQVEFLSDPDPDVQPMERRLYARARRLGVEFRPAVGIRQLTVALRQGRHPIVFYRAIDGEGHFSPVAAISNGFVELPHDNRGRLSVARFRIAWREPGFLRQTVIATRPPNQRLHPSAAGGSGLMEEIT